MFGLGELCLPVVPVQIRRHSVVALFQERLFLLDVPRTIVGVLTGKFSRVRLNGVRIEYLYDFAEVYALYETVDVFVIVIVREDDQGLRYIARLGQADDEVAEVLDAIVDLQKGFYNFRKSVDRSAVTCMTMTMESFCSGPNTSSLWTVCRRLYWAMLRLISDMFRGVLPRAALVTVPFPAAFVLFLGLGVRNLWRTAGTMLSIAAFESLNSAPESPASRKLRKFSWSQTKRPRKTRRPVLHRVLVPRRRPRRLRPPPMMSHASAELMMDTWNDDRAARESWIFKRRQAGSSLNYNVCQHLIIDDLGCELWKFEISRGGGRGIARVSFPTGGKKKLVIQNEFLMSTRPHDRKKQLRKRQQKAKFCNAGDKNTRETACT